MSRMYVGRGSVVCIATCCELDGPGIEFILGREFPLPFRPILRSTQSPIQCEPAVSWGKAAGAWPYPYVAPRLKKE
jgi:hypothetical protein